MKVLLSRAARRLAVAGLSVALLLPVIGVAPVAATSTGCTPGYWKNHVEMWPTSLESTDKLGDAGFVVAAGFENTTLLAALQGGGGSGISGARTILYRAAVAALLNSVKFPATSLETKWVYYNANGALLTESRSHTLWVANMLDGFNNAGCPL